MNSLIFLYFVENAAYIVLMTNEKLKLSKKKIISFYRVGAGYSYKGKVLKNERAMLEKKGKKKKER